LSRKHNNHPYIPANYHNESKDDAKHSTLEVVALTTSNNQQMTQPATRATLVTETLPTNTPCVTDETLCSSSTSSTANYSKILETMAKSEQNIEDKLAYQSSEIMAMAEKTLPLSSKFNKDVDQTVTTEECQLVANVAAGKEMVI
jgi:hypothetical protein